MLAATLLAASALAAAPFPETIPVPPGSLPEGIASGKGNTFYAGSRLDGSVYAGDYRTGEGEVVVPGGDGRKPFGLKYEGGKLYVAGGDTGKGFVYDARTGALLDTLDFGGVFVNDVTVTRKAAYFTDSDASRPFIYRYDRRTGETSALPISGDLEYVAGFNANGIAATPNGKTLIVVQSGTGKLFPADRRHRRDHHPGARHQRRRHPAARQEALRRAQPRQPDRRPQAQREAHGGALGADAHRSRLRRPHHRGGEGQAPVRDQRALRHAQHAHDGVRRRQGRMRSSLQ